MDIEISVFVKKMYLVLVFAIIRMVLVSIFTSLMLLLLHIFQVAKWSTVNFANVVTCCYKYFPNYAVVREMYSIGINRLTVNDFVP